MPWALFYPADYSVGSASLGFQYIFERLRLSGVAAERFFCAPLPYRSADADTMLERFSVITATVAYEGSIPLFYRWLDSAGIPLLPEERAEGSFPVVGAGGALSYINPLSLSGVCDFIILGDGMEPLDYAVKCLRECGASERKKLWRRLAGHQEILVPPVDIREGKLTRDLKTGRRLDLNGDYPAHSVWMTERGVFGKTLLLELQRGCARSCSYCTLPRCFGSARFRGFDIIEKALSETRRFGVPQAGLVTPEAGDYPFLPQLIDSLSQKNIALSFASLRVDRLDEKMISALAAGGRRSITIAPETGSDALRFSCGKRFTNALITEKLSLARERGIDRVKLYFMIGLPGETDEDVSAITELCRAVVSETGQSLTLSVNPFVPKPGTPWEDEIFAGKLAIGQKYEKIKKEIRSITKKTPRLRLTGIKEAQEEFSLAWYGFDESRELARGVRSGSAKAAAAGRERTKEQLRHIS